VVEEKGGSGELTLLLVLFRLPSMGLISANGCPNLGSSDSDSGSEMLPLWIRRGGVI